MSGLPPCGQELSAHMKSRAFAVYDLNYFLPRLGQPLSCVPIFATSGAVSPWAPLSMEFSRQEYWSGMPFPTSGGLPNPRSNSPLWCFLHWQADSLPPSGQSELLSFRWYELYLHEQLELNP